MNNNLKKVSLYLKRIFLNKFVLGMLTGIITATIIIALGSYMFVAQEIDNYSDEVRGAKNFIAESKKPVLQKNYILAGLTLSPDFQLYLQHGVEEGWWTTEYLEEVLADDVIPVYITEEKAMLGAVIQSDNIQSILEKVNIIKGKLKGVNKNSILYRLSLLKGDIIGKIPSIVQNLINNNYDAIKSEIVLIAHNFIESLDLENQVTLLIENLVDTLGKNISDLIDKEIAKLQPIIDKIIATYGSLEAFLEKLTQDVDKGTDLDVLLSDGVASYILTGGQEINFTNDIKIGSITLSAKFINSLDIQINGEYSNNGTLKPNDDYYMLDSINIGFESMGNKSILIKFNTPLYLGIKAMSAPTAVNCINNSI